MRRMKDEGEGMKAAEVETLTVPVPEESPMTDLTGSFPDADLDAIAGLTGESIPTTETITTTGSQPGEIVDREAYEAAIHAGSIGELPPRNIIYVGDGEPATAYHGAFSVEMPDAKTQKRGFYHPQARQIIGHFPKKYKKFIRIGE